MNIQSQQVEGTMKDYLKKGALNVWQHQVVYLFPLLLLLPTIGILGLIPSYAKNFLLFFVGVFYIFWFMEITFTTTQEKYNPKKYLASLVIAGYTMTSFLKRHIVIIAIMLSVSLGLDIVTAMMKSTTVEAVTLAGLITKFIMGVFRHASTNGLMDAALLGYISREIISDYFVTQRMTGMKAETPSNVTSMACSQNSEILRKFAYTGIFFTILSPIMIGFQSIVFIIMVAGLTFYSMEVFGIDTGKKQRQEETEKERKAMENMIPIPLK